MKPSDYEVLDELIQRNGIIDDAGVGWSTDLLRIVADRTHFNTMHFLCFPLLDIRYWPKDSLCLLLFDIRSLFVGWLIPRLDIKSSYIKSISFTRIPTKLTLYQSEINALNFTNFGNDSFYDDETKSVCLIKSTVHHLSLNKVSIQLLMKHGSTVNTLLADDSDFVSCEIGMYGNWFNWHFRNCTFSNVIFYDISNLGDVTFENCTFHKLCRIQTSDKRTHKKSGEMLKETLLRYGYKISPDCFFS